MPESQPYVNQTAELMAQVASLYYYDGLTQAEIARHLDISRIKVSRLLKRARDEGVVEINVRPHPAINLVLENRLKERFGLAHVLIAIGHKKDEQQRDNVVRLAAGYLNQNLRDGMVVAVSQGRNAGSIPQHIKNPIPRACIFVSATGGSTQTGVPVNPNHIGRVLADRFGGQSESLYAPAYADSIQARDTFLQDRTIRHALDRARRADMALVGIGDVSRDSHVVKTEFFSPEEIDELRAAGAVGDVMGYYYDIRGNQVENRKSDLHISLTREELAKIPLVVAVVSEKNKARCILGALRTKLVNVLITSVDLVEAVLELDQV
jgi:DNA-binding transcriptional regulator LsrR (DeoR family)